jgi:hypothetical protein
MLLNYFYSNFLEEGAFAEACDTSRQELTALIDARVFPAASYQYTSSGQSVSFVSDFADRATYRFHLTGHTVWFEAVRRLGLDHEDRARRHFDNRYNNAKETFLTSNLGRQLTKVSNDVPAHFNGDHADMTWNNFLNGVYGVCTRDGQPESIFLKQACVMFIDRLNVGGPGSLSATKLKLLQHTVMFLDTVESDFAPHEAPQTSRQRCIVDVNAQFFDRVRI